MTPEYVITSSPEATAEEIHVLHSGLRSFNESHAGPSAFTRVHLFVRDSTGAVRGGLVGRRHWDWLYVETLWVEESLRGAGLGSRLLLQAETEAREAGCIRALLDTFEFQALPFYQARGYSVFGVLEDYPPGYRRYYMQKQFGS